MAEILGELGMAALSMVAETAASKIWDQQFPAEVTTATFSDDQEKQLSAVFTECLDQADYQKLLDKFTTCKSDLGEYLNNPDPTQLSVIRSNLSELRESFVTHGYKAGQMYLATTSQYILVQRLKLDDATTQQKNVEGARKNVANAAFQALTDLLTFEKSYCAGAGWEDFITLKRFMLLDEGDLPSTGEQAFGASYVDQVQALMEIVDKYDKTQMDQIAHPPYILKWVDCTESTAPSTYDCRRMHFRNCQMIPQTGSDPRDYYPLSDCGTQTGPQRVLLVGKWKSRLHRADSNWNKVWNDAGTGASRDYAGFVSGTASGIGSWNADRNEATAPKDADVRCFKLDDVYYEQTYINAGPDWTDSGSGAHADGSIYKHPQFGQFGVFVWNSGHGAAKSITTIKFEAFAGFPDYDPKYKPEDED